MTDALSRRQLLLSSAVAAGATLGNRLAVGEETEPATAAEPPPKLSTNGIRYCFNTSTIRGQKLPIDQQIAIAAEAGYDGIEPWLRDLEAYRDAGGSLADLRKQLADSGMKVESAIAFAKWIIDDPAQRKAGLEQAKRDMDLLAEIGGLRIAAPPSGANRGPKLDLLAVADRYRALLEVGEQTGVIPQLEVWGFSTNLSRLGESTCVAIESGHPDACLLPDVYHIYKGGSDFTGLSLLSGSAVHVLHMNDYPADPPRKTIGDGDRVFPGDGVAPLREILRMLLVNGFGGVLSLELFNPLYWKRDALEVAKEGLAKMKAVVAEVG